MKTPSSQVSHSVTVQLVAERPEMSAKSLPSWSTVGAGSSSMEPAESVKILESPNCSMYHCESVCVSSSMDSKVCLGWGCWDVGKYLSCACLADLDVDGLGEHRLVLDRVALDPALAPGAGDDGGDEVEAGLELHLVFVWSGKDLVFREGGVLSLEVAGRRVVGERKLWEGRLLRWVVLSWSRSRE